MKRLLFTLPALFLAGCGTLFTPSVKDIPLSSYPPQADVYIDGTLRGQTPLSIELSNRESHTIEFRKEGHESIVCQLQARPNGGIIVLDILGGLVPVIIDAATGALKQLDKDFCNVTLSPNSTNQEETDG